MPAQPFICTVTPQFLPEQTDPAQGIYGFSYTVTVTNSGQVPAQLIARHWIITDATGHTEEVRGLGVIGHQPLLQPGERFEYTSWTRIATPRGRMQGTFFCITENAEWFETPVPAFELSQARALH
ncbi:Co2+/Mg2+ efflux protein ApaG [Sphaerotilus hippei]|nr:Co2+/Mg2+ efflux protein ApaG [Sphaerotilus hippei]